MASRLITDLDPRLQPIAQEFLGRCAAAGLEAILTATYRSDDEQAIDYAKGRSTDGPIITDEPPGHSAHNQTDENGNPSAKGFDFALYAPGGHSLDWCASDAQWTTAVSIGESLGLISGSHWKTPKDYPHLELANWRSA